MRAADLRRHLISMHGIDWANDALLDRDRDAMLVLHAEDHKDLSAVTPTYAPIPEHSVESMEVGTTYSIQKADVKERHWKATERERAAR